jgi:prolyl oligopeptidase
MPNLTFRRSAALLALTLAACQPAAPPLPHPPETRVEPVVEVLHGVEIVDPYRWLEDQESAETRAWIDAQNAYTDAVLADLPQRRELTARFRELMEVDQVQLPLAAAGRYFFLKRSAGQDLFVLHLRRGDGEDEVLLDPHALSEDHSTNITLLDASRDGTLLAYGLRQGGEDEIVPRLFDVDRRRDLPDVFPEGDYFTVSISPDNAHVYYTRGTADGPRLYHHRVGGDGEDELLFGDGYDPGKLLLSWLDPEGRYLLVHVLYGSAADRVDVYLKDLAAGGPFVTAVEGVEARFFASVADGRLLVHTDLGAPNGRIMAADAADPAFESWRELIAERDNAVIISLGSVAAIGGRLFVNYLEDVTSKVVTFDLDGRELGEVPFGALGSVEEMGGLWDSSEAFFTFSSFHLPDSIYRYDTESGELEVWARPEVAVDSERITVRQEWFESQDGTRVPMFLVHAKGLELDGRRPSLLTGYGGFTVSNTPYFSAAAIVFAERGGVFGLVNLRGGGEFGEVWHEAGRLANKQNVFDDFVAAAEWLIAEGYTRPEKLAIQGGSNGGLLVGAVMNQRPDLFAAVVCTYPLLDMLRYHRFLQARYWVPEYGSAEDPDQFRVLRAYSPYHNVVDGTDYPAVLYVTGDGDTRVAPLHARKMAARMQAAKAGGGGANPALLRYHTKAGHSAGTPLSEEIANRVESVAFILWQLGETR